MAADALRLLGAASLRGDDGIDRPWPAERATQLLAYLACRRDWVARHTLAALLWPELEAAPARRNLRKLVFRAARLPGVSGLESRGDALRWRVESDLSRFDAAFARGDWAAAMALYRGPLLEGLEFDGGEAFADWLRFERARLAARHRDAAARRITGLADDAQARERAAADWLALEPLEEDAVIALVEAQLALGKLGEARRSHRDHVERLAERLGIEPTNRLRSLAGRLEDSAAVVAATPRSIPSPPAPHAPWAPRVQFGPDLIGRRSELQMLERLLAQADCRVLTITGPGGIGKSRLARAALERMVTTTAGADLRRVWIALEDLGATDIEPCLARLAAALGIELGVELGRSAFTERLAALVESLRRQPVWIVFDNAEHLSGLPALARRLVDGCAQATLIVTSRTRLAIEGEWLLPLEGLPVPDPDETEADAIASFDAVRLFEQRARAVSPSFAAAPHAAQIATLVRAVEGMPLAIELAAAWVRLLPVAQIAEEIRGSLDLLERTGSASAEGRGYRSMRAAFEPSWALLAPREREVLAALSVLRAAFSRLAALAVAGASLAELASLADRSLLRGGDEGRFSMHPLMNRFAAEKLGERPDAERRALDAHAEYFLRTLAVHEAWHAIDQKAAIGQLALELPDALAALRRALALRRARQALAAIGVIGHFHEFTGRIEEGIALQDEVEAACADERDRAQLQARAQAALARSMLHYRAGRLEPSIGDARLAAQRYRRARDARGLRYAIDILAGALAKIGRHDEARRYSEQLLRAAERAGDSEHLALFLNNLALVESQCGFPDRALALYERSLAATRAIGDRAGIVAVLNNVATTLILTGRPGEALPLLADGLALADEAGFVAQRSYFLANLAQAEVELGHYDAARRRAEQGLDAIERGSDRSSAPACLVVLGRVAQAAGRPRDAAALLQQAIASARSMRVARHIVRTALAWARFAGEEGDPAGAARLLGCLRASGKPNAVESARIDALLVVLAPRLAADALAAALAEGGALALDDVLAGIAA